MQLAVWTVRRDLRARAVEKVSRSSVAAHLFAQSNGLVSLARNTTSTGKRVGGVFLKLKGVLEMQEIDNVRFGDLEIDTEIAEWNSSSVMSTWTIFEST